MACQTVRVTKKDLIDMLKNKKDDDFLGVMVTIQDGKEGECHQSLILYEAVEKLL